MSELDRDDPYRASRGDSPLVRSLRRDAESAWDAERRARTSASESDARFNAAVARIERSIEALNSGLRSIESRLSRLENDVCSLERRSR